MTALLLMEATGLCPTCLPIMDDGEPYFHSRSLPKDVGVFTSQLLYDRPLADALSCGGELIISSRACAVLKAVRLSPADRFIPTRILTQREKPLEDEYFVLHPEKQHDILNHERSEFKYFVGGEKMIRAVVKWTVRPETIPPLDLFYGFPGDWLATECTVQAVCDAGLTGLKFTELGKLSPSRFV